MYTHPPQQNRGQNLSLNKEAKEIMQATNSIYYFPRVHTICRRYCCLLAHQARG
jgi:hypothetical protein